MTVTVVGMKTRVTSRVGVCGLIGGLDVWWAQLQVERDHSGDVMGKDGGHGLDRERSVINDVVPDSCTESDMAEQVVVGNGTNEGQNLGGSVVGL